MALYCNTQVIDALDGMPFPATKEDMLEFAEFKDAPESVLVVLNGLRNDAIYDDISAVCDNVRTTCTYDVVRILSHMMFPARRSQMLEFLDRADAPPHVREAVLTLPMNYRFSDLDEVCEYLL